ncbi:MAG TPA: hypothetical protein VK796_08365 [Cytophaga sp.]|nr:hypothetical protein [Cytophaga sp.]
MRTIIYLIVYALLYGCIGDRHNVLNYDPIDSSCNYIQKVQK